MTHPRIHHRAARLVLSAGVLLAIVACALVDEDQRAPPPPQPPIVAPPVVQPVAPPPIVAPPVEPAAQRVAPGAWPISYTAELDGRTFHLAYQSDDGNTTIAEYLPRGQSLARWTEMLAVRQMRRETDPIAMGHHFCEQNDPCGLLVNENARSSIADFLVRQGELAEYNIWRIHPSPDGVGVVAYQHATRAYDRASSDALRTRTNAEREGLVQSFLRALLPPPSAPPDGARERYYTTTGTAEGEVLTAPSR
jgi:hypothetical protein